MPVTAVKHAREMLGCMLARIRISIPDQPGTLGRVASAIGVAGANVQEIQVLASDLGRAVDNVWVRVAGADHLDRLLRALQSIRGVEVQGARGNVSEVSRLGELKLISAVLRSRDLQVLVDQAVAGMDMTWAAVIDQPFVGVGQARAPHVLASSAQGPVVDSAVELPVRLSARMTPEDGAVVVIPLPPTPGALVLARAEGPSFHANEVFRLGELGRVLGGVVVHLTEPADA